MSILKFVVAGYIAFILCIKHLESKNIVIDN